MITFKSFVKEIYTMKKTMAFIMGMLLAGSAMADGQVFFRYGGNSLTEARKNQVFTDIAGTNAAKTNNDDGSTTIGAGLDLKLMDCPLFPTNSLLGEIYVDYSKFSDKEVPNAIKAVASHTLNGTTTVSYNKITVSELAVVVAPKYRMNFGKFRPWIMPVGLAFLVNNPPSDTTSYLDIGYHGGVGAEYMVLDKLSLGVDYRYTASKGDSGLHMKYSTYAGYVGINF